jgi:arylsulfatase A-like enzyme
MILKAARLALLVSSVLGSQIALAYAQETKPNIVIILADDLGNADLGYRGSDIKSPNIDSLANDGVRLESFYGMPVCTPSRAELMTGRYAMRYGLQTLVIFPSHTYGLPTDELTLPQALKEAGYQTAMVGKWHLGHADRKYWPQNRGFDHFYGNLVGEVDYFTKERGGIIDWQRDGKFLKEDGYFTTLIGNEAVDTIKEHDTAKPLFLYVASLAPHAPYQAPQKDIDAYENTAGDVHRHTYAAMITDLDTQVGRIVAALKQKNMLDNTLIIFSSDNGGATNALFATGARSPEEREQSGGVELGAKTPASNGDLRGGKGSLHEGGVRVPTFFYWQGRLKPGVVKRRRGWWT